MFRLGRVIGGFSKEKEAMSRLLARSPKTVEMDFSPGFMARLFEQSKK